MAPNGPANAAGQATKANGIPHKTKRGTAEPQEHAAIDERTKRGPSDAAHGVRRRCRTRTPSYGLSSSFKASYRCLFTKAVAKSLRNNRRNIVHKNVRKNVHKKVHESVYKNVYEIVCKNVFKNVCENVSLAAPCACLMPEKRR